MLVLPRLYAIADAGAFAGSPDPTAELAKFARELVAGGATLIQYRNKQGSARRILAEAREIQRVVHAAEGVRVTLIMNDRLDLAIAAAFDGVHLGQDDLSPEAARAIFDAAHNHHVAKSPSRPTDQKRLWTGVSTHSVEQVREAERSPADYIAIGPVFATSSKQNPEPVIGLEGVRAARRATTKPLVAIGGITRTNFRDALEAGADSVAVIGDLLREPKAAVREFLS